MKLFSALDVASKRENIAVAETKRLDTVSKELLRKRTELQKLDVDFDFATNTRNEQWIKDTEEHTVKIDALKAEVARLEERRKQNLFPLEEKFEQVDAIAKKLAIKEAKFKEKEEDFESRSEFLQEKLTELSEREAHADKLGKLQSVSQQGIDSQKAQIALQAKEMSKVIEDNLREIGMRNNAIARREGIASLQEKHLVDREKEIAKTLASFVDRETKLQDQYRMLERTKKEINGST
jgi:chromosome segregation ATPase